MSNLQIFELRLLQTKSTQLINPNNEGILQKLYRLVAGSAVCIRLKIQKTGYRILHSINNGQKQCLVLIQKSNNINSNQIKASYQVIQEFGNKVMFSRGNLGTQIICNILMPKITQAKELWIYVHSSSIVVDIFKQIVKKRPFIVSIQRQELYINMSWLTDRDLIKDIYSNTSLSFRRLIAENDNGKYVNYLHVSVRGFVQNKQQVKYNSCLFIPNKSKLVIQQAQHYHINQIVKIIKIPKLYDEIFGLESYVNFGKELVRYIDDKPEKKMILVRTSNGLGISSFLHSFAQRNQYHFVRINCKYFANEKQLIEKIRQSDSYSSTIIYVKNIEWLVQLTDKRINSKIEIKDIIKYLEEVFYSLGDQSLTSYILIISYQGNAIKLDMTKNADFIQFLLCQEEKRKSLKIVVEEFKKQLNFKFSDEEQVINLVENSMRWATFAKIIKRLKNPKTAHQQIKTDKVLLEIGKQINMQKVENIKNIRWQDIGGLLQAKQQIIQTILLPIKSPQIFDDKIKPRTGLLFYGPPGTGKTMLGKCIANQCKMSFISVKGPELLNMYVGESEKNVRDVFQRAAASKPCIVFMDELDALVPKRGQSSDSNQVMDRIVSQLLCQMDRASSNGIFIIGATNRPDLLDQSILRPGRFDKQIYLGISKNNQQKISILKAQTKYLKLNPQFNYANILKYVPNNFTGADFYGLTSKAIMRATEQAIQRYQQNQEKNYNQQIEVCEDDFINVAKTMKCSVSVEELAHYQTLKELYK